MGKISARRHGVGPRIGPHGTGGVRLAGDRRDLERRAAVLLAITEDALIDERRLPVVPGIAAAHAARRVVAAIRVLGAGGEVTWFATSRERIGSSWRACVVGRRRDRGSGADLMVGGSAPKPAKHPADPESTHADHKSSEIPTVCTRSPSSRGN